MRRGTTVIPIALVTTIITAGCGGSRVTPLASPSPIELAGDPTATVELLGVITLSGERVLRDSVISADLAYSVKGLRRGDLFLLWRMEHFTRTGSTNGILY